MWPARLIGVLLALGACDDDTGGSLDRERRELRRERELLAEERRELQREIEEFRAMRDQQQRKGLRITLPQGASTDIDPALVSVVVVVPAQGDVVINGSLVRDADVARVFERAFHHDPKTQVVFQAETGAPHGRIVGLMEQAKAAGLTRLAIGTR